ncbi:MAG: helix-turn-helix domain-containing protein [Actinobacteria bacterium]|nr:helix-turn-helix domain-containing protein [Actinomycetota bacterium]MBI3686112.1 helix-turn-helix domain-containing protein [Actinomycetota bacterium]
MTAADLLRSTRSQAGLSVRALADAAGVAASTVHRIERGELQPTVEMLRRIVEAAGMRLRVESEPDHSASMLGLARAIGADRARNNRDRRVLRAAEFADRFRRSDPDAQRRMITAEPPSTGDRRWDVFVAALTEWLAIQANLAVPAWTRHKDRYLRHGWWVVPMAPLRAWEYAGSPAPFRRRGVYLHRDALSTPLPAAGPPLSS